MGRNNSDVRILMVGLAVPSAYTLRTNKPYLGGPLGSPVCNRSVSGVCWALPFARTIKTDKSFFGKCAG